MTQIIEQQEAVGKLTPEQVKFYKDKGYVGVEGVFTAAEIAEVNDVVSEFIDQTRTMTASGGAFDLEAGHSAENPRVARIRYPQELHEVFDRIHRHPRLLDIISQLIGDSIYCQHGKVNIKPSGGGSGYEWHQDWAAFPHTNDDILAVGIALEDTTLENGCLLVVPGSHQEPIYDHHQDGYFILAVSAEGMSERAVPIELRAGGISIHAGRTLHASAPNLSDKSRRLLLFEYAAGDAWPLTPLMSERGERCRTGQETWDALTKRTVRGKLAGEPRMEKIPIRLPYPNTPARIYESQAKLKHRAFETPK